MSHTINSALLQLASPALPVGAFSYSQGLESAVHLEVCIDEATFSDWASVLLDEVFACGELALVALQHNNWSSCDLAEARYWNDWFLATKETIELRRETEQMGWSLVQLLNSIDWCGPEMKGTASDFVPVPLFTTSDTSSVRPRQGTDALQAIRPVAYPTVFAFAAVARGIASQDTLIAYAFAWLENLVAAAVKAIPLGQTSGQRLLSRSHSAIIRAAERAQATSPEDICSFALQLAVVSARHELQYSRLFRS
jgi:urease accessory protein